jgi:hypothetical protein
MQVFTGLSLKKGLFDICHYNFRNLEICHYNSSIWKYVITIRCLLDICHFVHILYS